MLTVKYVVCYARKVTRSVAKFFFSLGETQDKKSATKSVSKSVLLGTKISRKIRQENRHRSHKKNRRNSAQLRRAP